MVEYNQERQQQEGIGVVDRFSGMDLEGRLHMYNNQDPTGLYDIRKTFLMLGSKQSRPHIPASL